MELWCSESSENSQIDNNRVIIAKPDKNLLSDERVWKLLVDTETRCIPNDTNTTYSVQSELQPYMRRILANWMLEVSLI